MQLILNERQTVIFIEESNMVKYESMIIFQKYLNEEWAAMYPKNLKKNLLVTGNKTLWYAACSTETAHFLICGMRQIQMKLK